MVKPAVNATKEPTDILNPDVKAADMPEPLDDAHAKLIAEFLDEHPTTNASNADDIPGVLITQEKPDVGVKNNYSSLLEDD